MRRLLLIFFIFTLPLQFSWGAAARYCAHETGDSVSHVGHHSHVHKAAVSDSGSAAALTDGDGSDPDCAICHLSCAQPLVSSAPQVKVSSEPVYFAPETVPNRYRVPGVIERPKWVLAI